jgi:hypothetical protein
MIPAPFPDEPAASITMEQWAEAGSARRATVAALVVLTEDRAQIAAALSWRSKAETWQRALDHVADRLVALTLRGFPPDAPAIWLLAPPSAVAACIWERERRAWAALPADRKATLKTRAMIRLARLLPSEHWLTLIELGKAIAKAGAL